jgi:choline dehydrogenase
MYDFDYVIVGAGSAGCVLANRLSADSRVQVLLIEGGSSNAHPFVTMPRGFMKLFGRPEFYRSFPVAPQLGRPAENWTYGKGLGGSSSVNGTWYLRGMPADYDGWEQCGNPGWNWKEIARVFKTLEDYKEPGADCSRGTEGELQIIASPYRSPVLDAVIKAGAEIGLPVLEDINTPNTEGIGYTQSTVDRRGRRASSYKAFVAPIRGRTNLTVVTETEAKRIVFERDRAVGVECEQSGTTVTFGARREVVLCAGVLSSPKILQLSGVGPKELLAKFNIPIVRVLQAVGKNLSDHTMMTVNYRLNGHPGLNREFSTWRVYRHVLRYYLRGTGLMAFNGPPVTALISINGTRTWPDVQIGIAPATVRSTKERKADPGRGLIEDKPGIMFNAFHLRPKSKGEVNIRSACFRDNPQIDARWWSDDSDRERAISIVRLIRVFGSMPALADFVGEETVPGKQYQSDEEIAQELTWLMSPGLHGTGSCTMGPDDKTSVVDARLRVHGLRALRVVDCSIMPTHVSANTNGPAMVIGARAAELIAEDWAAR